MSAADVFKSILFLGSLVMAVAAVATVVGCRRCPPRLIREEDLPEDRTLLREARKETVERSAHFETLLVLIGSVELGILSYVAGFVVNKNTVVEHELLFFGLVTGLFFATSVAYLHTWKIYMAYGCYCVQLEIAGVDRGLRTESRMFSLAENPLVPRWIRPLVTAASSIQVVALYPVVILIAVELGFGIRFDIPLPVIVALIILTLAWSVVYASPCIIEYGNLVKHSCPAKSSHAPLP